MDANPGEDDLRFLEVPWELMAKQDQRLSAHPDLAFCPVRRIGKASEPRTPSEYRLSTFFMMAEPRGQGTPLRYEEEETAILNAPGNFGMDLMVEKSGNLELLAETMTREYPVDILHIARRGAVSPRPTLLHKDQEETRRTLRHVNFSRLWARTCPVSCFYPRTSPLSRGDCPTPLHLG